MKITDIYGYETERNKLTRYIELNQKKFDLYVKVKLEPPSRFLLYGPSGCGKTLAVNWIAQELGFEVIPIKRSSVVTKYFGESENNLHKLFVKVQFGFF